MKKEYITPCIETLRCNVVQTILSMSGKGAGTEDITSGREDYEGLEADTKDDKYDWDW